MCHRIKTPIPLKTEMSRVFHNHELRMKVFLLVVKQDCRTISSDNPDKLDIQMNSFTNDQLNKINFVGRLELALVKP